MSSLFKLFKVNVIPGMLPQHVALCIYYLWHSSKQQLVCLENTFEWNLLFVPRPPFNFKCTCPKNNEAAHLWERAPAHTQRIWSQSTANRVNRNVNAKLKTNKDNKLLSKYFDLPLSDVLVALFVVWLAGWCLLNGAHINAQQPKQEEAEAYA